jgi:hypothetical protein
MTGHLKDAALLDLFEGRGGESEARHLAECPACRERVAEAGAGLKLALEAEVPEPSPLYWESLRRQLGRRLEEEPRQRRAWFVPALVSVAAALLLVVGLLARGPQPSASPAPALPAWSPLPERADDVGVLVIQALAGGEDDLSLLAPCRGLQCLDGLSDEESRALAVALQAELGGRALWEASE